MHSDKILIKAPAEKVFEAIQQERTNSFRKLVSYDGKVAITDEELSDVPVYGKVKCVWQQTEEPFKRIDIKMLSSSKFKASHGAFILTPAADGNSTTLELQIHMDAGLKIPFAAEMTKATTAKDVKTRLEQIKKTAEKNHSSTC